MPRAPAMVKIGFIMRKLRKQRLTVRFTDEEYEKLKIQMQLAGYNSMSFYTRTMLLDDRIKRRNLSKNTSNLTREIMLLRAELHKIGVNYNQRVKTLNTLSQLRDKNGRVVANMADIDADNTYMKNLMKKMVKIMNEVYQEVMPPSS